MHALLMPQRSQPHSAVRPHHARREWDGRSPARRRARSSRRRKTLFEFWEKKEVECSCDQSFLLRDVCTCCRLLSTTRSALLVQTSKAEREKTMLGNNLRVIGSHQFSQLFRIESNICLDELAHFFKVANIKRRRKRVEETSWPVSRVAERMDCSNGHHHECALTGPQCLRPCQKLQIAFQDVKALFM